MKKKSTIILALILLASVVLGIASAIYKPSPQNSFVRINDQLISVEIARTDQERYQGLSNRQTLAEGWGMLFLFPEGYNGGFVMRDMLIALDIIWIANNQVTKIDKNLLPPAQTNNVPIIVYSPGIVQYVVEVNAGWSDKVGIAIGDPAEIVIY